MRKCIPPRVQTEPSTTLPFLLYSVSSSLQLSIFLYLHIPVSLSVYMYLSPSLSTCISLCCSPLSLSLSTLSFSFYRGQIGSFLYNCTTRSALSNSFRTTYFLFINYNAMIAIMSSLLFQVV